jgi:hypothetical protein
MGFTGITIEKYLRIYLKSNPDANLNNIRSELNRALDDYNNCVKCECGNDIWVIGSAIVGNKCFTCITGEANPDHDYEIDQALIKRNSIRTGRKISEIEPDKIAGYFDDDGNEKNLDLVKKPSLCLMCKLYDDPHEETLCNLNRYDQREQDEFICHAYKSNEK